MKCPSWFEYRRLAAAALFIAMSGCGRGLYSVRGTVTFEDGSSVDRGLVVFESADGSMMARGMIQPGGSYELSTQKPGDGLKPGRYRVLINPLDLSDVPDEQKLLPFDIKYTRFQTSGIEVEVKSGSNQIPFRVTRPATGNRRGN